RARPQRRQRDRARGARDRTGRRRSRAQAIPDHAVLRRTPPAADRPDHRARALMRCPFCATDEDKVIETRVSKDGSEIRRRRECEGCKRRYTTYERIEESMPLVIKADGRREPFDRNKIEHGIHAAVAKRRVSRDQVAAM